MRVARWAAILLFAFLAAPSHGAPTLRADNVVVLKKERVLILYSRGKEVKRYKIALGRHPAGPKTRQGDHKTPEGSYILDRRNSQSQFYKSIHISYPTKEQILAAQKAGGSAGG